MGYCTENYISGESELDRKELEVETLNMIALSLGKYHLRASEPPLVIRGFISQMEIYKNSLQSILSK